MSFELLPVVDLMIDLYQKPRGFERFKEYLSMLANEDFTDIDLPIATYNPMAKEHVLAKLEELKRLDAETILRTSLREVEEAEPGSEELELRVALVLADDLKGGWTNRYSTDYQNKFNLKALIQRRFCTPVFWVSEALDVSLIDLRTRRYLYRTLHQMKHPRQATLEDHLRQEAFVNRRTLVTSADLPASSMAAYSDFYQRHKRSTAYPTIFNFLYGDQAAKEFGLTPELECEEYLGFKIAHLLAGTP